MKKKTATAQGEGENVDAILEEWERRQYWEKMRRKHRKHKEEWKKQAKAYQGSDPKIKKIIEKLQENIV